MASSRTATHLLRERGLRVRPRSMQPDEEERLVEMAWRIRKSPLNHYE
jgi:hypothetical protein